MKQAVFIVLALLFTSWCYSHEDHQQSAPHVQQVKSEASMIMTPAQINTLGGFIIAGTISCLCLSYFIWRCWRHWRMQHIDNVVFDGLAPDAEIHIHEQLPPPILFRMHTQPPHPLGAAENV